MKKVKPFWILGGIGILLVILVPVIYFWPRSAAPVDDPWAGLPEHPVHTSHADIIQGPFETPQEVTRACLECHPDSAAQIMATTHWTWESEPFEVPWRDEPVTIGKINQLNNFCISARGNQRQCMSCHTGYNWQDGVAYDFSAEENVDCLVCHADTSLYARGDYGNPAEGVDLLAAARSVRVPTRENCGSCHFNGGGGNDVKHGDLAESLYLADDELDIHMGNTNNLLCTDCHVTVDHQIRGRLVVDNYRIDPAEQVACTDCHAENLHADERINAHVQTVACQTCHIPVISPEEPTKIFWDWSAAGQDLPEDHYTYLKIKGSFVYESDVIPQYLWFNGNLEYRYLLGDPVNPDGITYINIPAGSIDDPTARIFPFKLHVAIQPYDLNYNYLLTPVTAGPDGYWTNFDWDNAFRLGAQVTGLPYSGEYGFTETWMYWPTTHMVQPAANALQCADCHGAEGRLDWRALGYPGDPIEWGGRFRTP
ncbi:MAG: tetrathionate reductase family octaheme c-type cytochrome [Anaerolineales bacterium]